MGAAVGTCSPPRFCATSLTPAHATNAAGRRGAVLESRSDQAAVLPVRERVQCLLAVAPRLCPAAESKGQPTAAGVAAHAAGP